MSDDHASPQPGAEGSGMAPAATPVAAIADVTAAPLEAPAAQPSILSLRFTASGSEYFRIWIVNLLLIVVTLGFYLPFAKARRLRYFYANTLVDGQPLAFHGDAWKMFRGYLVMLLLFGAYAGASYFSEWVAFGAFVVLALLWPALWRSSMMFRMANTSWRGLRFGFQGSPAGAYQAMLPVFLPSLVIVAMSAYALSGIDPQDTEAVQAANQSLLGVMGLTGLAALLLAPLALWMIKAYQHSGYRYSGQAASFEAPRLSFYKLGGKLIGVGLLMILGVVAVMALLVFLFRGGGAAGGLALGVGGGVAYLVLIVTLGAVFSAGVQNASWNATRSQALRFDSQLSALALARLSVKNIVLVVLTLGLYRPFAVVHVHRLRLEAVSVTCLGDIGQWVGTGTATQAGASGEMSGDFFGIDMGL